MKKILPGILNEDTSDTRIKLDSKFKKEIFTNLLKNFGWRKLVKELEISRSMLYHYKNNRTDNISLKQLIKCAELLKLDLNKISYVTIFSRKKQINKSLKFGMDLRHKKLQNYRKEIPKISEFIQNHTINLELWLMKYINLINFGCREIKEIKKDNKIITLKYTCYSKSKKELFENNFPKKIKIDKDFEYFFGLWCGDRVGKGRFGVANKNKTLNFATKDYLHKLYQNPVSVLQINEGLKIPKLDYVDKTYINKSETKIKGYSVLVYSKNAIFFTFFDHIIKELDKFLNLLNDKGAFFAGLFDAEGNVLQEDNCFRWACKDEYRTKIYIKHLKQMGLFNRYDGGNIVCYNSSAFGKLILPYLKHPDKINSANLVCYNKGKLGENYVKILKFIIKNKGKRPLDIAKPLNMTRIYPKIKFLESLDYIELRNYPKQVYMTEKGMASLLAMGERTNDDTSPLSLAAENQ